MKKSFLLLLSLFILNNCSTPEKTKITNVPSWAKEAVWYQIFPERFANGDQNNDPRPNDMEGAWPYFTPDGWQIHPWTSDWYKLQPWEAKLNKNFYEMVNIRRYGGDLQGVIDKLDYLKELGITAIYLNPIFESPSLHKYDATYYHHIDNNFGPDPEGDREIWSKENHADPLTWQWTSADKLFLKLIEEVHKRNMKIIIDGVFNHTGTQFWAFKDIVKNQQNSQFKDWFIIKNWDDPNTRESEFEYAGWMGVRDLPEIKEDENGLVKGPREHVHAVVKRWMDPNGDGDPSDGIDGWRLDVAEMVNHNFWKDFRKWVREINSEAYIVGEVWWENWNNYKMFNAAPWLGDQFDAVMNYRFTRAVKDFILADKVKISASAFVDTINTIMGNYKENYPVMMNLLGSHDTERLGSLAVNPDGQYDHQGNVRDNKNFDVRKPNEIEYKKIKLAYGIQFTMPGAPQIYNGDEAGMWGGDDPDCRKPNVWPNIEYEAETTHPFNKPRPVDTVKFDQSMFNWIKKLAQIRNTNKALSLGNIKFEIPDSENNILIYKRIWQGEEIVILVNRNADSYKLQLDKINYFSDKKKWNELISGMEVNTENSQLVLIPYQIMILK
ncbi:MAG: alpha-amylase [Ignavibacteria bacterium]|nr:alpha-amylase [Ignavibacteria bacterium]